MKFAVFAVAGAIVLMALPGPARARGPVMEEPVLTTVVYGELAFDVDGNVVSAHVSTPMKGGLERDVEKMVQRLRFEALDLDGTRTAANTQMRLTLGGTALADGNINVRIDNITFPDTRKEKEAAPGRLQEGVHAAVVKKVNPQYPESAVRHGVNASVLLEVHFDMDGRILDVSTRQTRLLDVRAEASEVAGMVADFELASRRAVKGWQIHVDVDPGATPRPDTATAFVAMVFSTDRKYSAPVPGEWHWETRSVKRRAPWLPVEPNSTMVGAADVDGDSLVGEKSRIRLVSTL